MSIFNFLKIRKYIPKILEIKSYTDVKEDLIAKIFDKELDLILIKNSLPKDSISKVISILNNIPDELTFPTPFGILYGKTLVGSMGELKNYSDIGLKLNNFIRKKVDVDLNALCEDSIFKLSKRSTPLKLANTDGVDYSGYTIKVFNPQKGGLHVDIGSEFLKLLPECEELAKKVKNTHQISFFYVLQAPEKGGELTLFDLDWESSPPNLIDKKNFYSHEEREKFFLSRRKYIIKPEVGDLIVFNGGQVWHKVNDVIGTKDRVTFGGFLGRSLDGAELLYWN